MNVNQRAIKVSALAIVAGLTASCSSETAQTTAPVDGPYLATGIKIGEVTQDQAIVWVRATANQTRAGNDAPVPTILYRDPETGEYAPRKGRSRPNREVKVIYPEGHTIDTINGAAPGSQGEVRLKYRASGVQEWTQMKWQKVDAVGAFAHEFELSGLTAGSPYELLVEARPLGGEAASASLEGSFTTAPAAETSADINFIVTTGTSYGDADSGDGYKLYPSSLKLDPDFFVHTGDIVYYDGLGKTLDLARYHWDRMYSFPNNVDYHRQVPSYFMKDDHDTWMNDAFPMMDTKYMGEFTYKQGEALFLDEVPMGEKTYRTVRWGKDLQIWMVEGRDYRSSNTDEDSPEKTIWGAEQIAWFKSTVEASDATYKILISPTPIVGPDRVGNKSDNHANVAFTYEGDMLRKYISAQKNMVIVSGDRHWQYASRDLETGLLEFNSGPGGNGHAGGWDQDNVLPEHIYLNVVGGFLEGAVENTGESPTLKFRYYDPDGKQLYEYVVKSE